MVAIKAFRVGFERQAMSTATRKMKIVKVWCIAVCSFIDLHLKDQCSILLENVGSGKA